MRKIEEVLARRSDLSTFIVHLTRDKDDFEAKDRLKEILRSLTLRAESPMGHAIEPLKRNSLSTDFQKCVAFTETPLEHVALLLGEIEGRMCSFAPYGIAITKKQARRLEANPIWYVDITPGHEWLSNSINSLIQDAIRADDFENASIFKLTPFIEQMGTGERYHKEFWWEREWRSHGDFYLPDNFIILCPQEEVSEFKSIIENNDINLNVQFVDSRWRRLFSQLCHPLNAHRLYHTSKSSLSLPSKKTASCDTVRLQFLMG